MREKPLRFAGSRFLFGALLGCFLLMTGTAGAESVDSKIKALEEELQRLKAEQAQVKSEQLELKKESAAAAAALPTFTHRPGSGVTMMAADRGWAINFRHVLYVYNYNMLDGNDARGGKFGDLFFRRHWFWQNYCWDDCFYDIQFGLDLDTRDQVGMQYSGLYVHFEQMNPYFPTLFIVDQGGQTAGYVRPSRTSSATMETARDLLSDSGAHTLSHRAVGLGWINVPLGQGDAELTVEYKPGTATENQEETSDRAQLFVRAGARPYLNSKNPWLEKLKFGAGWQTDSIDSRQSVPDNNRLRLMSDRAGGISAATQTTLLDTGASAPPAVGIGDGQHHWVEYGLEWGYGPWLVRNENGFSRWEGRNDGFKGVRGHYWSIGNELFLYSPKGLFTGSSRTPGSLQLGWTFSRAEAQCGTGVDCAPGTGSFSRNRTLHREVALIYYIRPAFRLSAWWGWWDSANTPLAEQVKVGCSKNTTTNVGKSCDWHTLNIGFGMEF